MKTFECIEYIYNKIPIIEFEQITYICQNYGCEWDSWVSCFMVYDIDIHELNVGPFQDLKFLDEISFKKVFFLHF